MKTHNRHYAFTIIELLTVMSIITILISILVPGLNKVRRYARNVSQKNQFHKIGNGLEFFVADNGFYPSSDDNGHEDGSTVAEHDPYCGAMKLAEAMVGKDMMGYNPKGKFLSSSEISPDNSLDGNYYYDPGYDPGGYSDDDSYNLNISGRTKYVNLGREGAEANYLQNLYFHNTDYDPCDVVLTDLYDHFAEGGEEGMPILYYRANSTGFSHPNPKDKTLQPGGPTTQGYDYPKNVYDYDDNDLLVQQGTYEETGYNKDPYKLASDKRIERFYRATWNENTNAPTGKPYREDSFILISAGWDGKYFTGDDVYNFSTAD